MHLISRYKWVLFFLVGDAALYWTNPQLGKSDSKPYVRQFFGDARSHPANFHPVGVA